MNGSDKASSPTGLQPMLWCVLLWALLAASMAPGHVRAQTQAPVFSDADIDQMLAPIALYPDVLLSQILIAATYPLEVVEAARWSASNAGRGGTDVVRAAASQGWDPSVQALVAFPDLLQRMDEDLDWTRRLGDAWLMQEADVSDRIQHLRQRADAAGHLRTTEQIRARRDNNVIIIEQANPQVVYVPYYQPAVVYGSWWHAHHPPVYWAPPRGYHSGAVFYFGPGIRLYSGFFYSRFDWPRRQIVVVNRRSPARDGYARWRHDPRHRRGVTYRSPQLNRDFSRHGASINANRRPVWQRETPDRRDQRRPPGRWQGEERGSRHADSPRNDARTRDRAPTRQLRPPTTRPPAYTRSPSTRAPSSTRSPAMQERQRQGGPQRDQRRQHQRGHQRDHQREHQREQRGQRPSQQRQHMRAPNAPSRPDGWQPRGRSARE